MAMPPEEEKTELEKFFQRTGDYLGSLLAIWGFIAFWIIHIAWKKWRSKDSLARQVFSRGNYIFLATAAFFPIVFFFIASLGSKVEANWAAMYLVGASFLLTPVATRYLKTIVCLSLANLFFISLAVIHGHMQFPIIQPDDDRILQETNGYKELALYITDKKKPVFADTYQITSMVNFYSKDKRINQWPGITRYSNFTLTIAENIDQKWESGFTLITRILPPPAL